MKQHTSTEAWRQHAAAAHAAGADERLGEATSAWGALLSAWTAVADELANQARRAS